MRAPSSSSTPVPAPEWWEWTAVASELHLRVTQLVAMFDLTACRFEPFPFDAQRPRIEVGRIIIPAAEPGIAEWSGAPGVELPLRYAGFTLGRFVLVPASPTTGVGFSPAGRARAISIAADMGEIAARAMLTDAAPASPTSIEPSTRAGDRGRTT